MSDTAKLLREALATIQYLRGFDDDDEKLDKLVDKLHATAKALENNSAEKDYVDIENTRLVFLA